MGIDFDVDFDHVVFMIIVFAFVFVAVFATVACVTEITRICFLCLSEQMNEQKIRLSDPRQIMDMFLKQLWRCV